MFLVSSAKIWSTLFKTSMALSDISFRLPIGVDIRYNMFKKNYD